jgi:4-hydroxybutyryl-CoA dehydratase/vinylacetyl-CoA-Delta-isomerase
MALMTAQQFVDSLRKVKTRVYFAGKRVENMVDHPVIRPSINAMAATYALAQLPEWRDLMVFTGEDGQPANICCSLMKGPLDLVKKFKTVRKVAAETARGHVRTVGMDAMNAVASVVHELDEELGTGYSKRFHEWFRMIQANDYAVSGAITDPKGLRNRRPKDQPDPDHYLRVVEERKDGIVVRGAKVHQTVAVSSHWHVVAPTTAMREDEADHAVAFAVPCDAPGVFHLYGRQMGDMRKAEGCTIDVGNVHYGSSESLMVFDNVFVPWEHVFMYKEWQFTRRLVERFANYHRQGYGASRAAMTDVVVGAVSALAEMHGLGDNKIIRDKLTEMTVLGETMYACGLAASYEARPTPSGIYIVDEVLVNVAKLNVTRLPYEIGRLAEDIAGGLFATAPHESDFRDPETGPFVEKYLKTDPGTPTEHRLRLIRLVENMCYGTGATYFRAESMHGAGSPEGLKLQLRDKVDWAAKRAHAKRVCGIEPNPLVTWR